MRRFRFLAAAFLAVFAYVTMPLISASVTSSLNLNAPALAGAVAYADAADDACASNPGPSDCADGYRAHQDSPNISADDACSGKTGDASGNCKAGYSIAPVQTGGGQQCDQGSFTWLFCPMVDGIATFITSTAQDLLSKFLSVEPLTFNGPIYDTWNSIKTLTNVAFVLVFMIVIFSHTTRIGISTYSFKKILPRLVAAAILVQASYLISALIVDTGNILGAGVSGIISGVTHSSAATSTAGFDAGVISENVVTALGLAIVGGLILMAWPFAVSAGLMLLISILAAITVIAIRYFLIGLLIVLSPLAFIAWILPSTESYFKRWRSTFVRLVLMYPLIILILSMAGNVTALIPNLAQPDSTIGNVGQSIATLVVKVLVLIGAFGAITQTFKWANGFMEMAYNRVNGLRSRGIKAVKDSQRYEEAKDKTNLRSAARGDKIDSAMRKMIRGEGKFARGARGTLVDSAGLILAARGSTSARSREMDAARVINKKVKQIGEMRGGNDMMNWRRALSYYYGDDAQRAKAYQELRDQGAEAILDHTGDLEGRQAIMRKLADNNLTGPDLTNQIKRWAEADPDKRQKDYRMFAFENGKNIVKTPALFARYDKPQTGDNILGQPTRIGDINAGLARGFLAGLMPEAIKDNGDFKLDNYKVASNYKPGVNDAVTNSVSQQWAKEFFTDLPREAFLQTFDHTDRRTFKGPDKRGETLIALARHKDMMTNPANPAYTPELHDMYNSIVSQVSANWDHHRDAIRYVMYEENKSADPAQGIPPEDILPLLGINRI